MDDKIDTLHRRINNSQFFNGLGKRTLEEFIVKFNNDFLLAFSAFDTFGTEFHTLVEVFKAPLIDIFGGTLDRINHALQRPRDGVVLCKVVIFEQRLEYGLGYQMLRKHLDCLLCIYTRIQVFLERCKEFIELLFRLAINGDEFTDAVFVTLGDVRHILCPIFPIATATDLFDHLGINCTLQFLEFQLQLVLNFLLFYTLCRVKVFGVSLSVIYAVRYSDASTCKAFTGFACIELNLVHHCIKAVIVCAEGVQDFPHHLETLVVVQGIFGLFACRDNHGDDDVAVLFAGSGTHYTTDTLHHIHFGITSAQEQHRIKARNINTFAQTTYIVQNAAVAIVNIGLEPRQQFVTARRSHTAIDMLCFDTNRLFSSLRL